MKAQRRKSHLAPPVLVTETPQLASLVTQLARQPLVAVDTESNSLYAYREQVCLIQLSTPSADYLVDPLSDLELGPLGQVFADPGVEKVFHAAEYDVMCLRRDYGWTFANLFDTMWTARVLGWPHTGLGNILQEQFGVRLDKRWQRHDWGRRPLSPEALAYARLDTHYLLPLRERMLTELEEKGRREEACEFFVEVAQSEPHFRSSTPTRTCGGSKGCGIWNPRSVLCCASFSSGAMLRPGIKIVPLLRS
jgi:ribonuclease D